MNEREPVGGTETERHTDPFQDFTDPFVAVGLWGSLAFVLAPIVWGGDRFFAVSDGARIAWEPIGKVFAGLLITAGLLLSIVAILRAEFQHRAVRRFLRRTGETMPREVSYLRRRRLLVWMLPTVSFVAAAALSRLRFLDTTAFLSTSAGSMLAAAILAAVENQRFLRTENT